MSGHGGRAAAARIRRRPCGGRGALAALVVATALLGCERESRTMLSGHPVRGYEVEKLAIGKSTPQDVERVLGPPDERAPDGSLVYRATAVRRSGRSIAGFTWNVSEEVVGEREATFRFTSGVLRQICRESS